MADKTVAFYLRKWFVVIINGLFAFAIFYLSCDALVEAFTTSVDTAEYFEKVVCFGWKFFGTTLI